MSHSELDTAIHPEKKHVLGKRIAVGALATAALLGADKLVNPSSSELPAQVISVVDKSGQPTHVTVRAGGLHGEKYGEGYGEALERAGEMDHDNDGTPNESDPDVDMYGVDEAIAATGTPAHELQYGQRIVAGEIRPEAER